MFDVKLVDIAALPSVTFGARRELPAVQGVYFVSADASVLYIGKAKNLNQRWAGHHRITELAAMPGVTISWLRFDGDEDLLSQIETACIEYFNPALNWTGVVYSGRIKRSMNFPPRMYARLEALALRDERSVNELITSILREYLRTNDPNGEEA